MHLVSLGCLCFAFPPPASSLIFQGRLFWGPNHRAEIRNQKSEIRSQKSAPSSQPQCHPPAWAWICCSGLEFLLLQTAGNTWGRQSSSVIINIAQRHSDGPGRASLWDVSLLLSMSRDRNIISHHFIVIILWAFSQGQHPERLQLISRAKYLLLIPHLHHLCVRACAEHI